MTLARLGLRLFALVFAVALGAYMLAVATGAQTPPTVAPTSDGRELRPATRRALSARAATAREPAQEKFTRPGGRAPLRHKSTLRPRPSTLKGTPDDTTNPANANATNTTNDNATNATKDGATSDGTGRTNATRRPRAVSRRKLSGARLASAAGGAVKNEGTTGAGKNDSAASGASSNVAGGAGASSNAAGDRKRAAIGTRIPSGTSMSIVLHTSQLSTISAAGANEQFADLNGDLFADSRATFDTGGGSFDIAVGRTGTRYSVFSATDDRGTSNTGDDLPVGVLVLGFDQNQDFTRDSAQTFDLSRDFNLPSAVSVVAGTSRAGREFVAVSSSGYFNFDDPDDPANEPTAGVVLLVRDAATGGFDASRSRELVRVGDGRLNNANALALLPTGDLLIADFDSNELRVVRDTNADGMPDTLDPAPFYSFLFSSDAPVEVAANSRGVVFTHSVGNSAVLLALYDTNADGRADAEEVVVEGLSIDNNLILHGLAVDREGTVFVVEDATGASDLAEFGGNLGTPLVDAFPDPALNGILRDGALYVAADNPTSQALSGLAFGFDPALQPVSTLAMRNSASLQGPATRDGLGTITGAGLTRGRAGLNESDASARGVVVTVEGVRARVLSFDDSRVNVYVPNEVGAGPRSVVVWVDGFVAAAEDAQVAHANPGLFTLDGTGTGTAVSLLASGMRYTAGDVPARFEGGPSVVALFGTGWRNSLPVTATVGGRAAVVEFAGPTGFPGLDQLNVRLPEGAAGTAPVVITTADGAQSRAGVTITIK